MIKDYLKMSFSNIQHKGMRSWLTMIGIFVGIAAVVSLISVGQGMQVAIEQQFEALGTDILLIQPLGAGFITSGADNPVRLTEKDENEISKAKGIMETAGWVFRSAQINFKDDVNFQFVAGVPSDDPEKLRLSQKVSTFEIASGRNLEPGDKFKAVAGHLYTIKDDVFPQPLTVGDKVYIKDKQFDIVGIFEKTGSPPDDRGLQIPMETAEDVLEIEGEEDEKTRDMIVAQVGPGQDPEVVAKTIHRQLMNFRDLDDGEEDFQVQTAAELLGSFNTILDIVQAVLVGIAAISLLVGGVGITNTMYTSVLERTKEIGIMKAIGARNSDIMTIFLVESGMLGMVGGIIGVALGYGISALVTAVATLYLGDGWFITYFPSWLIIGGLGFAFLVGALSGVMPARQASKMNPVDALRYE